MQALIFFAMFGFLAAVVGSLITLSSLTTQKFRQMMVEQTRQQFTDIAGLINKQLVGDQMQGVPPATGSSQNIASYLCGVPKAREFIDCTTGVPLDPWHHAVTGKMVRETRIMMTRNNLTFKVPVNGYALLSAGSDGVTSTTIPTANTIAALTAMSAGGDDILQVFTDEPGQQTNAIAIQTSIDNVGRAAQVQYQRQFNNIKSNLPTIYNDYMASSGGQMDVTSPKVQNAWKVWSDSRAPTYTKLFTGTTLNSYSMGADGDVAFIQRAQPAGGNMTLNARVLNSDATNNGVNDTIGFTISTTNTVWQQANTPNCNAPAVNCARFTGGI